MQLCVALQEELAGRTTYARRCQRRRTCNHAPWPPSTPLLPPQPDAELHTTAGTNRAGCSPVAAPGSKAIKAAHHSPILNSTTSRLRAPNTLLMRCSTRSMCGPWLMRRWHTWTGRCAAAAAGGWAGARRPRPSSAGRMRLGTGCCGSRHRCCRRRTCSQPCPARGPSHPLPWKHAPCRRPAAACRSGAPRRSSRPSQTGSPAE